MTPRRASSATGRTAALARERFSVSPETVARVEWLILLLALTLVALVYPLRLQNAWLIGLRLWIEQYGSVGRAWWQALEPMLNFFYSPLVLRGAVAGVAMLAFTALCVSRWLTTGALTGGEQRSPWAWFSVLGFLGWVVVSAAWSPTPDVARDAAGWASMFGVFFFVLLRRGISTRERRQLAVGLVALGAVVLAVLFMQALPVFHGSIFKFMYRFNESERNLLGSLIGHNTAAAAFVLLTIFPALGLLATARSRGARGLSAVYLFCAVYGILLLQSRSIWILGPFLILGAVRSGLRLSGLRMRRWIVTVLLAGLTFSLLTQTVDRPWNPFFLRYPTLAQRLRNLSPEGLLKESRLRLNIIGVQLVPERPLIGHGLFAFQFIYPAKQGAYFNTHVDSPLHQTTDRSNMAHNEYMQVLIDHGLIGLALIALMYGEIAVRGRRLARRLSEGDRLLQAAFGWCGLGVALHAAFDFPLHVPQLLLPAMICVAAWTTDRRAATAAAGEPVADGTARPTFRPRVFARLLGALMALGATPILATWPAIVMQADAMLCTGTGYRRAYEDYIVSGAQTAAHPEEWLMKSLDQFVRAATLTPSNYQVHLNGAQTYLHLGEFCLNRATREGISGTAQADALRRQGIGFLNRGLNWNDETLKRMRYHYVFFQRSRLHRALARVEPDGEHERDRIRALQQTLAYCPTFLEGIRELDDTLSASGRGDPEFILGLRRRIYHYSPTVFDHEYVYKAYALSREGRHESAALAWESILLVDPTIRNWRAEAIESLLLSGRTEKARGMAVALKSDDPVAYYSLGPAIPHSLIDGDWRGALELIAGSVAYDAASQARRRAIEEEARRRLDESPATMLAQRPPDVSEEDWRRLVDEARPEVLYAYFLDPTAARRAFEERLAHAQEPPSLKFLLAGVRIGLLLDDPDFARENLERARTAFPTSGAVVDMAGVVNRAISAGPGG
jgi:O-antigen ligase/tetratricopeptide (TPR) repeat protein